MENQPKKNSTFSNQFVAETRKSLALRRSRATFTNLMATSRVSRELRNRWETFCCTSSTPTLCTSQDSDRAQSCPISTVSSPLPQDIHIQGWMYWAHREDSNEFERYTKVYAVLRNEFLLLYRTNQRPSKTKRPQPLVQIAVANFWCSKDEVLHVVDPYDEEMELHLYERQNLDTFREWNHAFEQAVELTLSHFSKFDVKVDDLSRGSAYRGTLHDFRKHSTRRSVTQVKLVKSWRKVILNHCQRRSE